MAFWDILREIETDKRKKKWKQSTDLMQEID